MAETRIVCCASKGWCRAIAWYQIFIAIWFGFVAFGRLILASQQRNEDPDLVRLLSSGEIDNNIKPTGIWYSDETSGSAEADKQAEFNDLVLVFAFQLFLSVTRVIMAALLLHGSYTKNIRLIILWIIYAIAVLVLRTCIDIFHLWTIYSNGVFSLDEILYIFYFLAEIFCLWMVSIHKKDVLNSLKSRQRLLNEIYSSPNNHMVRSALISK